MKILRFALTALASAAMSASALADIDLEAIKLDGFARGVVLTVKGYSGTDALADFPVLVRVSGTAISGFDYGDMMFAGADLSNDLRDIAFTDGAGNLLPFEIDTWNPAGESLVWVKLPSMSKETQFAMFWRSSKSGKSLNSDLPFSGYTGVWHLNESGSGSAGTSSADSSGSGLGAVAKGCSASVDSGKLGGSWMINDVYARKDAGLFVDAANYTAVNSALNGLGSTFHVSFWFKTYGTGDSAKWCVILSRRQDGTSKGWGLQLDDTWNALRVYGNGAGKNAFTQVGTISGLKANVWTKIDVVWYVNDEKAWARTYANGVQMNNLQLKNDDSAVEQVSGTDFVIGNFVSTTSDRALYGEMDEVRLAAGVPSADRVKADFDTVNNVSFLVPGEVSVFAEAAKPIGSFAVADTGAAFVQFSGSISSLGGEATSADVKVRVWPKSDSEPEAWTTVESGLKTGDAFSGFVTGLDPLVEYRYEIKAVNNLETPQDSDVVSGDFTTSGVGDAGAGGSVERQLDEFVHVFTVTDRGGYTFDFTPPADVSKITALLVAGGGPGGYFAGGGGGAGGVVYAEDVSVTGGETYTVNVGTGGVASASIDVYGANGGDSSIMLGNKVVLSAAGGGAGGNGNGKGWSDGTAPALPAGQSGGSGGGASWTGQAGGAPVEGQGNTGGTVPDGNSARSHGAGGGGAGSAGSDVEYVTNGSQGSGAGGSGARYSISGADVYYAGGGGGGGRTGESGGSYGSGGAGGTGGGGSGGQWTTVEGSQIAQPGADGLGGGGGGGSTQKGYYAGGNGGSGVVIVRYGAGGDGTGAMAPTVSFTGISYDDATGVATVSYRVGWAGAGCDKVAVSAMYGDYEDHLEETASVSGSEAVIGRGSGSFTLPRASKTVYVRLKAVNANGATGFSPEVKPLVLVNPGAPSGAVSAIASYKIANLTVDVTSLGEGAASVEGVFQICEDKFFDEGTYSTVGIDGSLSAPGTLSVRKESELEPGKTYWLRALLTNDVPYSFETAPISFTMLPTGATAGMPSGVVVTNAPYLAVSGRSITAGARIDSFGVFATSATVRLEASTDNFKTKIASDPVVVDTLGETVPITVSGLSYGTAYTLRLAMENRISGSETSRSNNVGPVSTLPRTGIRVLVR